MYHMNANMVSLQGLVGPNFQINTLCRKLQAYISKAAQTLKHSNRQSKRLCIPCSLQINPNIVYCAPLQRNLHFIIHPFSLICDLTQRTPPTDGDPTPLMASKVFPQPAAS